MSSDTVIVTGGAGYIGSVLSTLMKKLGYNLVIVDNLSTGHRESVQDITLEEVDVRDVSRMVEVFERYNPCAVIHLAAFSSVGESVSYPDKYYDNNVIGCIKLLEAMRVAGIKYLIYSSSAAIFGTDYDRPIQDNDLTNPINPYGMSKLICENIMQDYKMAYDFHYISLRYFNAAGAHPSGKIGELHIPETHLIPLVLEASIDNARTLTIYGDDYDTIDGTCVRDYVHVYDLAYAHVLALQKLMSNNNSCCLNLGAGQGISVKSIIDCAQKVTKHKINYIIGNRREGDPAILVCDNKVAKSYLGWSLQYSNIEDIISHAWQFLQYHNASK